MILALAIAALAMVLAALSEASIAGIALVGAAGVTAAASVAVAWVSRKDSKRGKERDALLVATLSRLDSTMGALQRSTGRLEGNQRVIEIAAKQGVTAAKANTTLLQDHIQQDERVWEHLGIPHDVVRSEWG